MSDQPADDSPPGALGVLTVLDLSEGVAGPYAAMLLAAYGARVVKVERPGSGDRLRRGGTIAGGEPPPEGSLPFRQLNAGKLGLSLDYETAAGARLLARLAEDADAIIEDAPTRRQAALGLDAETLIAAVPRLVITTVKSGPTAAATAGLHVFYATLAALWSAAQTEHGQVVEVDEAFAIASDHGPELTRRLGGGDEAAVVAPAVAAASPTGRREGPSVAQPEAGRVALPPPAPFRLTAAAATAAPAPLLGEHTRRVLGELLGLEAAALDELGRDGVV